MVLEAVPALSLIHEHEGRAPVRDQNVVFRMRKDTQLARALKVEQEEEEYEEDGREAEQERGGVSRSGIRRESEREVARRDIA